MTFRFFYSANKIFISFFTISAIVVACAKLPVTQSFWNQSILNKPTSYTGFDKDSGIRYTIANDSTHLFVYLDTDNRMAEGTLLRQGLIIYFDTTGKKHRDCYFQYPYHSGDRSDFRTMMRPQHGQMEPGERNRLRNFKSPTMAYWHNGSDDFTINSAMLHTPFKYSIQIDSLGFLNYRVSIPLHEISKGGYKSLNNLSIGIQLKTDTGRSSRFRSGGFRGNFGGRESGEFGERGEGGRRGGYGERDGDNENRQRASPLNVEIWLSTKLAKSF